MWTSSPVTVRPSTLTHSPIDDFHPIIESLTQEWALTLVSLSRVVLWSLTPSSTSQPAPTTTSGPNLVLGWT